MPGHLKHGADGHLLFAESGHLALTCGCDCNNENPATTTQTATITLSCGDCTNIALGTPSYAGGTWTWAANAPPGCNEQMVTLKCKANGNWELGIYAYANDPQTEMCSATVEIPCADIAVDANDKFVPTNVTMNIPATCTDPNDSPVTLVWA